MTVYVTLNDDGTLSLESDDGGSRTVVADDTGTDHTEFEIDSGWGCPQRAKELVGRAIDNALADGDITLAISVARDGIAERVIDDR